MTSSASGLRSLTSRLGGLSGSCTMRAQEIDARGYSLGLLQDEAIEIAAADEIQKAKFAVLHD
jgi:hypothetical protein